MSNRSTTITVPRIKQKKSSKCNCELCTAAIVSPTKKPNEILFRITEDTDNIPESPEASDTRLPRDRVITIVGENEDTDGCPYVQKIKNKTQDSCEGQKVVHLEPPEWPETETAEKTNKEKPCNCRKRKFDIIRRNKMAVRILQRQLSQEKRKSRSSNRDYNSLKSCPSGLHTQHWAAAYSLARSQNPAISIPRPCPKKCKCLAPKPSPASPPPSLPASPPHKKPEKDDFIYRSKYCGCEQMANAMAKADIAHHMSLSEHRDKINASHSSSSNVTDTRNSETNMSLN